MSQSNTAKLGPTESWKIQSVQNFFSEINWENVAVQMPLPTVKSGERTVNPNMTVSDFFSAISWEGEMVIAAPSAIEMNLPEEDEADDLTLDDFSGLF